ncbi:MAG TPA: DUF397 domain-containing protein [Natronosporangium sp.]
MDHAADPVRGTVGSCSRSPRLQKGISLSISESLLVWRRSTRCDNSACVEVAQLKSGVALRDSTLPDGPTLSFPSDDWASFVANLRAGTPQK